MRGIQAASPAPLRWLAHGMTAIGNWPIYPLMAAVAVAVLDWCAASIAGAAGRGRCAAADDLADAEGHRRPRAAFCCAGRCFEQLSSPAFPSGHVLSATLLFGVLVYVVEVAMPHPILKRWLQAALVSMIVLMGYARVELGEHWPTDVMGGWAVGALMLFSLCRAHRMFAAEPERVAVRDD